MKFRRTAIITLMVILAVILTGCSAQDANKETQPVSVSQINNDYFVDTTWLNQNLTNVTILDARKADDYKLGHIPGAINATWQEFAAMSGKSGDKGWGILQPKAQLEAKFGAFGLKSDKTIVVYTDPNGWGEDGRLVWMFRMTGFKNTKMLNGGWPGWKSSGGKLSTEVPSITASKVQIAAMDESMVASTEWITANSNNSKIVDARTKKEYDGATDFGEKRGGHLLNAINIPFKEAFNDEGELESVQELKELFSKAGLKPENEIVTYCTKGIRSANLALILRMAGFEKARNYDASFYEWAGSADLQLVK